MNKDDYHILYQSDLFANLSAAESQKILGFFQKMSLKKGEYLFHEGDNAAELFIITEGEMEISKQGSTPDITLPITMLHPGDMVGEMTLFDSGRRSASVKAMSPVSLMRASFADLKAAAEKDLSFSKILLRISKNLSLRLRKTNESTINALERELEEHKLRVSTGSFMVNVIVALCLFSFALSWLSSLGNMVSGSGILNPGTVVISVIFFVFLFSIIKFSGLPLSAFGLTMKGWWPSLKESFLFTSILCVVIVLIKWILIHFVPGYIGKPWFNLFHDVTTSYSLGLSKMSIWALSLMVYCFFISPLQELIARGGLQGPLEIFLTSKYRKAKAIVISNIMFSTGHIFISMEFAVIVFFAGLYFGWLYSRHRNLLGVTLAHALLGGFSFWIVGK